MKHDLYILALIIFCCCSIQLRAEDNLPHLQMYGECNEILQGHIKKYSNDTLAVNVFLADYEIETIGDFNKKKLERMSPEEVIEHFKSTRGLNCKCTRKGWRRRFDLLRSPAAEKTQ